MHLIELRGFKNLQIVSAEGYSIGNTFDLRYNSDSWKIKGIRFAPAPRMRSLYPNITSKVMLMPSNKFHVNDVILTGFDRDELLTRLVDDDVGVESSNALLGVKIETADGILLGTVDSIHIDSDTWYIMSLKVKLDKGAHKKLGISKGLFSKVVSGLLTTFIKSVGPSIKLKLTMDELKPQLIIEE